MTLRVFGLEDGDALDRVGWESDDPSEGNGVAGDGLEGDRDEGNLGLSTLAGLEGSLAGEGGAAESGSAQLVDAVGPVDQVVGQDGVGDIGVVVRDQAGEAVHERGSGGVCQARSWVAGRGPVGPTAGSGSSSGDESRSGGDGSEGTHVD